MPESVSVTVISIATIPIFRRIRDAVLGLGFRFSAEDAPLWRDYQALSLPRSSPNSCRPGVIPLLRYRPDLSGRMIETKPKETLGTARICFSGTLKRNYAFHESVHCLAWSVLRDMGSEVADVAPAKLTGSCLRGFWRSRLLTQSKRWRQHSGTWQVSDGIFFPLNSHFFQNERREEVLNGVPKAAGSSVFRCCSVPIWMPILRLSGRQTRCGLESPRPVAPVRPAGTGAPSGGNGD